ncbi:DUF262 domain-containing protein [Clostridium paraputrificum]|uniref:DUF262 domain-containing protein n=1 Tax=Clostridium paraputrificum TaxID=29363 RepID=UPI0034A1E1E0
MVDNEKLEKSIDSGRNNLKTDRLDMSYGEIINMYKNKELIISPQFQRLFRWDNYQRTRFIESILLGIPTPPIFVAEDNKGNWELVDGLQRISTVVSFFGFLRDDNNSNSNNNWAMDEGALIKELEGYSSRNLPPLFIKNIKRTYCRVEIIKWDSEYDMRYELFNRLNTGGSPLKDQEIRNCIFRGTTEEFNDLLEELSQDANFKRLIAISEQRLKELYDQELILRFIALYNSELESINTKNMSEFMTNYMRKAVSNKDFDYDKCKIIFRKTMDILSCLEGGIFKFANNQFSTSLYDAITVSIANNIEKYSTYSKGELEKVIEVLKSDDEFRKYVGAASSSRTRVVKRMERAFEIFNKGI